MNQELPNLENFAGTFIKKIWIRKNVARKRFLLSEFALSYVFQIHCNTFQQQTRS